jgi:hypothetical protein
MKVIHSPEMSVLIKVTPCRNPEDGILHSHHREDLKYYKNICKMCAILNFIDIHHIVFQVKIWSNRQMEGHDFKLCYCFMQRMHENINYISCKIGPVTLIVECHVIRKTKLNKGFLHYENFMVTFQNCGLF